MNEQIEKLAEQVYGCAHYDDFEFAGLVAQAVLDQLVAAGALGTDGTAYRAVQAQFNCP